MSAKEGWTAESTCSYFAQGVLRLLLHCTQLGSAER